MMTSVRKWREISCVVSRLKERCWFNDITTSLPTTYNPFSLVVPALPSPCYAGYLMGARVPYGVCTMMSFCLGLALGDNVELAVSEFGLGSCDLEVPSWLVMEALSRSARIRKDASDEQIASRRLWSAPWPSEQAKLDNTTRCCQNALIPRLHDLISTFDDFFQCRLPSRASFVPRQKSPSGFKRQPRSSWS